MSTDQNTTADVPAEVTLDRIITVMDGFDIELTRHENHDVATANLNGTPVTFALLGSVFIVRADSVTDQKLSDGDPTLYLAANQVNCVSFGARAAVVDRAEQLVVRTERDVLVAAGMTDPQLTASLRSAVDGVLAAQDGMLAAAQKLQAVRAAHEDEAAQN
ncbi:YbjN domain-containing protein [Corynebacterium halotolerans]|uniref:YbjN domain-containing protein n=1 Tax=Corynebacterium halotolerans YIM 70093 = DSM 44683 TaxID=1121362 RepID=M1NMJ2_9CORY|nr:YbjN domain-containing protein [Corynebacterium halotolerans]AGF72573.1 hypothetical protein A605_07855 [Corynebacterium halotolerans YIM 70093 = DSM 44683]